MAVQTRLSSRSKSRRDLASRSEQFRESIGLGKMPRLAEILFESDKQADREIDVHIDLLPGMQGFPEISGQVKGSLDICCQRCLGSITWPVEMRFHLIVVGSETDIDEVADVAVAHVILAEVRGICCCRC